MTVGKGQHVTVIPGYVVKTTSIASWSHDLPASLDVQRACCSGELQGMKLTPQRKTLTQDSIPLLASQLHQSFAKQLPQL